MKAKPLALAALVLTSSFVAGESVVVLARAERAVHAIWVRSRSRVAVNDAAQMAQRLLHALVSVVKF